MSRSFTIKLTLFIILLLSAILRFYGFDDFSLTNDELSAIYRTDYSNFQQLIQKGVIATDPHPAGVQVFLSYWIKLFGDAAFWVRLPFVLASIFSVYLVFSIGKEWFGESSALLTAAFIGFSEFAITYGQIARPYSFGFTFCLLLVLFWTRIIKSDKPAIWTSVGYVITAAACCYNHYFSGLFAILVSLTGFFMLNFKSWTFYLGINLLVAVLFIPHLPITLHQLQTGGLSGWLPKPEAEFFREHLFYIFNDSIVLILVTFFILVFTLIRFGFNRGDLRFKWLSLIWFLFPIALGYIYSNYHETVLMHRVLIFTFPFLILFIFSFVNKSVPAPILAALVFLLLATGTYSTVVQNKFYRTAHFEDFRILTEKMAEWDDKYGADNITQSINLNSPKYISYYAERLNWIPNFKIDQTIDEKQLSDLLRIVNSSDTKYFTNGWACISQPREVEEMIRNKYPFIVDSVNVFNAAISIYSKKEGFNRQPILKISENFDENKSIWNFEENSRDSSSFYSTPASYVISNEREFGLSLIIPPETNNLLSAKVISVSAMMKADTTLSGQWVIHVKRGEVDLAWYSMPVKDFLRYENGWNEVFLATKMPENLKSDDTILIYYWNNQRGKANIDDVKVAAYSN